MGIPRGKPSTLKFVDLTDHLDLGPRWKKKKVRLTGDPNDWDLDVLEDTRSRIKKMLSALKERGMEGRQEFTDFLELEKELAELIKDRQVDPRSYFDFLLKLLLHPTAWEARLDKLKREARGQLGEGRTEGAKKNFRRVLFFKEEDAAALKGMGLCLFEEGDLEGARSFFEKALRFAPRDGKTLQLLGKTCHRLGDKEAARESFNGALVLNPDHAEPYSWLGILAYE
ncbi:MAG TPA: tetratricopeptide repeat protein, partial [Chroococcales cyanobacterium]